MRNMSNINPAAKIRRRDRLLALFGLRSRHRFSPSTSTANATTSTASPLSSPSSVPPAINISTSLPPGVVDRALQQLSESQRMIIQPHLSSSTVTISNILEQCLMATRQKQREWNDKRWAITFGRRTVSLGDEADKIIRWLDRFKAIGDVVANADPTHVGLPRAGVRLLLEVATSDMNQMAALLVGCNMAMYTVNRLKVYMDFLLRVPAGLTQANFEDALTDMHSLVLAFLADALQKLRQPTPQRMIGALWQVSEVDKFEKKCGEVAARLETEASNCDRCLAAGDSTTLGQAYQDLQKALKDIAQIHDMQATLDRVERKLDLDRLKRVTGAAFDAYEQTRSSRTCHSDTRVSVLESIQQWAQHVDGRSIFWLSGMAGTGKSTISRTVAKWLTDSHGSNTTLGASFFFKRGEGDRGSAALLFPTLAHQLTHHVSGLDVLLAQVLDNDPDIASKHLSIQFAQLISGPLQRLLVTPGHPTYIIVLDALDECDANHIRPILKLWSELPDFVYRRFRLFLTSRPDMPVLTGFDQIAETIRIDTSLQDVPAATIRQDIATFLRAELKAIQTEYNQRPRSGRPLQADWPGEDQISALADMATPQFIAAATMCFFVALSQFTPDERLSLFFRNEDKIGHLPQMAQTYLPVLQQITADVSKNSDKNFIYDNFRKVVGSIVVLAEPLTINALVTLLDMSVEDIRLRLHDLHSVLEIPDNNEAVVRPPHLSFGECLTNPELCKEPFWVESEATHRNLWKRCLFVLKDGLKEDVCDLGHPGQLRKGVNPACIRKSLPLAIQYACRYWIHHVCQSQDPLKDNEEIHTFLRGHFIHWLEALSLLDRLADAIGLIKRLRSLVTDRSSKISQFLEDAYRFVLANRRVGEVTPLQLYSSAIVFAPHQSVVRTICGRVPEWIKQSPVTPVTWSQELQRLEGHTSQVRAVSFSPDGSLLASASGDETVRVWDTSTGQQTQLLEGHTGWVTAVSFSPDGLLLASVSGDSTVRIWDTSTGQQTWLLEGHMDWVNAVSFSPDGSLLASASADKTVRVWDASTGQQVQQLQDYHNIKTLVFTTDGQSLHSNRGFIKIDPGLLQMDPSSCDKQREDAQPDALTLHDEWVECSGERILWLPQEYRSACMAFARHRIAFGLSSGRVDFLQIDHKNLSRE